MSSFRCRAFAPRALVGASRREPPWGGELCAASRPARGTARSVHTPPCELSPGAGCTASTQRAAQRRSPDTPLDASRRTARGAALLAAAGPGRAQQARARAAFLFVLFWRLQKPDPARLRQGGRAQHGPRPSSLAPGGSGGARQQQQQQQQPPPQSSSSGGVPSGSGGEQQLPAAAAAERRRAEEQRRAQGARRAAASRQSLSSAAGAAAAAPARVAARRAKSGPGSGHRGGRTPDAGGPGARLEGTRRP